MSWLAEKMSRAIHALLGQYEHWEVEDRSSRIGVPKKRPCSTRSLPPSTRSSRRMTSCGIEAPDVAKAADLTKVSMTPPKDKAIRKDVPQFGPSADISTVAECIHDVATQDDDGKISYNAPGTVALVDDGAYDVPIQSSMGRVVQPAEEKPKAPRKSDPVARMSGA